MYFVRHLDCTFIWRIRVQPMPEYSIRAHDWKTSCLPRASAMGPHTLLLSIGLCSIVYHLVVEYSPQKRRYTTTHQARSGRHHRRIGEGGGACPHPEHTHHGTDTQSDHAARTYTQLGLVPSRQRSEEAHTVGPHYLFSANTPYITSNGFSPTMADPKGGTIMSGMDSSTEQQHERHAPTNARP